MTNYNETYENVRSIVDTLNRRIDELSLRILNGESFTTYEIQETIYRTNLIMSQMLRMQPNSQLQTHRLFEEFEEFEEGPRRPLTIIDLTVDDDEINNQPNN
jgi:hypothetical protein